MKVSAELMLFAARGAVFGSTLVPDDVGKVAVFPMAFICWVAANICRAIERNGRNK